MANLPSKKQSEALAYLYDNTTNFIGYGGAAFGGKSYLLCTWIVHMSFAFPGTGWGIGRKELTTLKKTTLLTLYKVFQERDIIEGRDYKFNGQLNIFTFTRTGSQIFLIDMAYKPSDPLYNRFGGYELTGAAVDESAEVEEKAIEILYTRVGRRLNHRYGIPEKILETFNPAKNHIYNRYWKPYKNGTLKKTYAFVRALPADNPSPEVESYVRGIKANADPVTVQRLIYGNFDYDDDPDSLCGYEALTDLFENSHVPEGEQGFLTCDIAMQGSDKFVVFVWRGWVVVAVYSFPKVGGQEIINHITEIKNRHSVWSSSIVYDADGVGGFIGTEGGFFKTAKPFHNNGRALKGENYQNLKAQCGFRIASRINKRELYIAAPVDSRERELMLEDFGELKRRNADQDTKLQLKRKRDMIADLGRSPDYLDALIMREYIELLPRPQKRKTRTIRIGGY